MLECLEKRQNGTYVLNNPEKFFPDKKWPDFCFIRITKTRNNRSRNIFSVMRDALNDFHNWLVRSQPRYSRGFLQPPVSSEKPKHKTGNKQQGSDKE